MKDADKYRPLFIEYISNMKQLIKSKDLPKIHKDNQSTNESSSVVIKSPKVEDIDPPRRSMSCFKNFDTEENEDLS